MQKPYEKSQITDSGKVVILCFCGRLLPPETPQSEAEDSRRKDRSREKSGPCIVSEGDESVFVDGTGHSMERGQTGEAGGLAVGCARIELRIGMTEEATHVVADNVQTFNGEAIRPDRLQVGVDVHTRDAAEDPAAQGDAVERAVLDRREALGHLSEVLVHALLTQLIIAGNGLEELLLRLALDLKLIRQIFQRVGFLQLAGIKRRLHEGNNESHLTLHPARHSANCRVPFYIVVKSADSLVSSPSF